MRRIILEGTDGVGKTTLKALLSERGIFAEDRERETISANMLFSVDMAVRAERYEKFLLENDVALIFMVNRDKDEIVRRIYSRNKPISEFDKMANEYNELYEATYRYMAQRNMTHGKLLLADCTGLGISETFELILKIIREAGAN